MIRYVVDHGAPTPLDDVRCRHLRSAGFRRAGAYRAGTRGGEVWVDADGSTMVAVEPLGFGMSACAQTVLEDGTHVTTEERPPLYMWLPAGPGVTLPKDRTSLRFPRVRDVEELLARHREHVAEVAKARRSAPMLDGSTQRYAETRNEAQRRAESGGRIQLALAGVFFVIGAIAAFGVGRLLGADIGGGIPFAVGFGTFIAGFLFLGPALIHAGLFGKSAARVEISAKKDEERVLHAVSSRAPYVLALYFGLFALTVGGMALKGVESSITVISGFSLALAFDQMLSAARNRLGGPSRPVTYEIAGGELRIEGQRPIALADITAVLRSDVDKPSLAVVDRRGRVAARVSGPAAMLDELHGALALERATLPVKRDGRSMLALTAPLGASLLAAWKLPANASAIYFAGALLMMLVPLIDMRRRAGVEVGVDGVLIGKRFVAFAEIASLSTTAERLEVTEKSGKKTKVSLALVGSAAEIARRWQEHSERTASRDADIAARRRVAVAAEEEEVPYRVRVATAEELGDMLLDSSEDKSVRLRAARRLAHSRDDEASRVRDDVEDRVVDPDVRQELRRPHD